MTESAMGQGALRAGSPLRTPRAAAVAGIIFSVLLIIALTLLRVSAPPSPSAAGIWLTDSAHRAGVAVGLNLVPFAGIAFLWFIGVLRDRIGEREDRFFATVFLGSGLLFVGMLFVAAAVAGALVAGALSSALPGAGTLALGPVEGCVKITEVRNNRAVGDAAHVDQWMAAFKCNLPDCEYSHFGLGRDLLP